jgi:magnesium-transporting ATPase (P-type)
MSDSMRRHTGDATLNDRGVDLEQPHALSAQECLAALDSRAEGLEPEEAIERLEIYGHNKLPGPELDGPLKRFFQHFDDILIYILLAAAVLKAILLGLDRLRRDPRGGGHQRAHRVRPGRARRRGAGGIRKMLSLHAQDAGGRCLDRRRGRNLVPGDIMRLKSGDRVPADVRLLEAAT